MLVFLYHLGVPGFASGYMGVDVFFVLSGFLITSLLLEEMDRRGKISLPGFWARRVRRLMPALVLMLLVVVAVTHATATFSERSTMRGDLLATTTYAANWHFISSGGYFNDTGFVSPLRHTWSLAIEEQFYLVWPLVLVGLTFVLRRARLAVLLAAGAGAVASVIALAMLWAPGASDRAYMGTDARMFEPLVGALAAAVVASRAGRGLVERNSRWLTVFGLAAAIAGLIVVGSGQSVYYFGGAALVSVATALLISGLWCSGGGLVQRSLSWRPLVQLGVISYGVYLWHWPFVVWLHLDSATGMRAVLLGALSVIATIVTAAVSYVAIERPIRRGRVRGVHARRRLELRVPVALGAVPLVMLILAATSFAATTVPKPKAGTPVVMLTGDSVPMHLESTFERVASDEFGGWRVVSAARGGCSVSAETTIRPDGRPYRGEKCSEVVGYQKALIRQMDPDVVVWWDRWSMAGFATADGTVVKRGTPLFWRVRARSLARTIDRLTRRGAVVLFVAVEPPGTEVATRCEHWACMDWMRFMIDHYQDVARRWNATMRAYASSHPGKARYISITDLVCHKDVAPCVDTMGGVTARPDGTHYQGVAADRVVRLILSRIRPIVAPVGSVQQG